RRSRPRDGIRSRGGGDGDGAPVVAAARAERRGPRARARALRRASAALRGGGGGGGKGDEVAASGVTSRPRRLVSLQRRAAARLPRLPPPRGADFLRGRDLAAVAFTRLVRRLAAGAAFFFAPP